MRRYGSYDLIEIDEIEYKVFDGFGDYAPSPEQDGGALAQTRLAIAKRVLPSLPGEGRHFDIITPGGSRWGEIGRKNGRLWMYVQGGGEYQGGAKYGPSIAWDSVE
jgi:hypothetical protein